MQHKPFAFRRDALRASRTFLCSVIATLALFGAISCGDATGPSQGGTIRSGEAVTGRVGGDSKSVRLRYTAVAREHLEIRLRAPSTVSLLRVLAGGETIALVSGYPTSSDTITKQAFLSLGEGGAFDLLVTGSGTYRLELLGQNRKPESAEETLVPDQAIEERFDTPRDADDFTFMLDAPATVSVVVELGAAQGSSGVLAYVRPVPDPGEAFDPFMLLAAPGAIPGASAATGPRSLPAGTYVVVMERDSWSTRDEPVLSYRLSVQRVNSAPEGGTSELALGDTIASSIEAESDLDDYVVHGAPGSSVVAFVQATGTGVVRVHDAITAANAWSSAGAVGQPGMPLLAASTGLMTVPASGTLTLRVQGGPPDRPSRGAYRLFAYAPDSLPEGRAPTVDFGETITGRIEAPGDVDVYRLTLASPATVNVVLARLASATADPLMVRVRQAGTDAASAVLVDPPGPQPTSMGTGRMRLAAGTWDLRVGGASSRGDAYVGGYELRAFAIDSAPETRAGTILVGETVRGEAVEVPGDLDVYRFSGTAADTVVARIVATTPGAPLPLSLSVVDRLRNLVLAYGAPSLADGRETSRLELPGAGSYEIHVGSAAEGRAPDDVAPYVLELERVESRPEHAGESVAVGDSVRAERLDYVGDVDGFTLLAPAGREVVVRFAGTRDGTFTGPAFVLRAFEPGTGRELGAVKSVGFAGSTSRVVVPASGHVRLRVSEDPIPCSTPGCPADYHLTGSYWFAAHLIDRAPEGVATALAVGDTVDERIDPVGDVDEYTFAGAAGERLLLQFDTPQGTCCSGGLQASLLGPSDDVLASLTRMNAAGLDAQPASVTLPVTGTYRVRIEATVANSGMGRYLMRVGRAP